MIRQMENSKLALWNFKKLNDLMETSMLPCNSLIENMDWNLQVGIVEKFHNFGFEKICKFSKFSLL